jgi:uncharacterized protein (DUF362 family)
VAPLSRREFIESTALATAALATPISFAEAADKLDLVDVQGSDIQKMVDAALEALGGMSQFVKPGDYVVVKANVAFANPESWGTTTHPQTVIAVIKACLAAKAKAVTLLEFPQAKGQACLDRCGLTEAMSKAPEVNVPQVKIKVLSDQGDFKETKVAAGKALKSTAIAKALLSADRLINVPAAKHHEAAGVSLGLKNAMGLIWDRKVFHTTLNMHQGIADLATVIRPDLTILDATRALLTNGPSGPGETATPGRIAAGRSAVSVDAYGLTLARFNQRQMTPDDAPHIKLAAAAGLGEADIARLKVRKIKV